MKVLSVIAISALVYGGQPLISDFLPEGFSDQGSAFAKNNGNKGNKGNRGKSAGKGKAKANNSSSTRGNRQYASLGPKPKNLHARLKGLNSLNRNINGLMNSSDPKMDLFREFVMAGADYEISLTDFAALVSDIETGGTFDALLATLGLGTGASSQEIYGKIAELTALSTATEPVQGDYLDDAAYLIALAEWDPTGTDPEPVAGDHPDTNAFNDAQSAWSTSTTDAADTLAVLDAGLVAAAADVTAAGDASSENALIEAMVAGLNATGAGPVTAEDMDPDMVDWVSAQMGVGDADGFIDAYLTKLGEDEAAITVGPV